MSDDLKSQIADILGLETAPDGQPHHLLIRNGRDEVVEGSDFQEEVDQIVALLSARDEEAERLRNRMLDVLHCARAALASVPQTCRYHGSDFFFLGSEPPGRTVPRCDSCKQPHRVVTALNAIDGIMCNAHQQEATDADL